MESRYLKIEIREDTLALLLVQRRLVAEELRGLTPRARRQLRRMLLDSLLPRTAPYTAPYTAPCAPLP